MTVGGSASIGGDVDVGALDVAGVLIMPSTASVRGVVNSAGGRETAEVSVAPPCRCDADAGVDVAAVVEAHRETNDDEAIGLVPTAFASLSGDSTQELPCGLYFLDGVGGQGTLTIHATGRAAVFVRGDHAPLAVKLDQGAELDLFVEGELHLAPSQLGDPSRPTALRLYSAGAVVIDLSQVALSALLYAPDATMTSSASRDLFGSLVVGNVIGGWGGGWPFTTIGLERLWVPPVGESLRAAVQMNGTTATIDDHGRQAYGGADVTSEMLWLLVSASILPV